MMYRKPELFCHPIYIFFIAVLKLLFEVGMLSVINKGDCVRCLHTWHSLYLGFINGKIAPATGDILPLYITYFKN